MKLLLIVNEIRAACLDSGACDCAGDRADRQPCQLSNLTSVYLMLLAYLCIAQGVHSTTERFQKSLQGGPSNGRAIQEERSGSEENCGRENLRAWLWHV